MNTALALVGRRRWRWRQQLTTLFGNLTAPGVEAPDPEALALPRVSRPEIGKEVSPYVSIVTLCSLCMYACMYVLVGPSVKARSLNSIASCSSGAGASGRHLPQPSGPYSAPWGRLLARRVLAAAQKTKKLMLR
eukprot:s5651_g8.t1